MSESETQPALEGVAIIGMSGRFPGARNVAEFWRNQLAGIESISRFRLEELEISNKAEIAGDPRYVMARSILEDVDLFDADFFGIHPREAELMDPQQRLFLECCWEAMEDAGYIPDSYQGQIGVYAGSSIWSYFLTRLCTSPGFIQKFTSGYQVSNYFEMMGNSLDFLSTRVSYKLNLRGPSCTMLSACSTSLLAVTEACQSLLTYQSDMALAGGVSITFPQKRGYYYQDGGMVSADGRCRAFDAGANGTVFGSGVGVVLLKRVEDAIRDGDHIYAVIRGFAVNNDGSTKVGYTAPSVEGQASVIAMAQAAAGVDPETIGYIEAHGTGTPLGDPIELTGLTKAFRAQTSKKQFCTIGTAKTNVGHLDVAAGVTGLINAAHVVQHGVFPATLHFNTPNPNFDFENSPFQIVNQRTEWKTSAGPRRAGISAFGVGGTNAHVIIEQAPEPQALPSARSCHLLVLSARSPAALDRATDGLAARLKEQPNLDLADVAWTLQAGRRAFDCRRAVTAHDLPSAIEALSTRDGVQSGLRPKSPPQVYFLFPGQGSQHPNMAREIYLAEPTFRDAIDRCADILRPHLNADLRTLLYPADDSQEAKRRITETAIAQPAIFAVEYALAQLWISWGIRPKAMVGHSIGEFVAACVAGVLSLEDALALVALRGRTMQDLPRGGMLSVRLPESEVRQRLPEPLSMAAVNSPSLCVVAGAAEPLERFERQLVSEGIACRRLVTSHAFHSVMMDPVVPLLADALSRVRLAPPQIPYLSSVTGTWITAEQATDPQYWARHAREPVQFSAAIKEFRKEPDALLLEVGPGNVLATLTRQHQSSANQVVVSSLSDGFSGEGDYEALMSALGASWVAGEKPDWSALHQGEQRLRVSLPTYPFERKRYWYEDRGASAQASNAPAIEERPKVEEPKLAIKQEVEAVNIASSIASPPGPGASPGSRATQIYAALAEMFGDLSGTDLSAVDGAATFLELGFDSLFLTQVTQALYEKFRIKVTFRQLLNDVSSLKALTEYLDRKLPPDQLAEPVQPVQPVALTAPVQPGPDQRSSPSNAPVVGAAPGANASIEQLMRDQLQAMNQLFAAQLDALRGVTPGTLPAAAASAQPAAPVPQASPKTVPDSVGPAPRREMATASEEIKSFGPYKPPQTAASKDLTRQQKDHLDRLIDRLTKRTAQSKKFTQQHRKELADPRVVSGFRPQWKELVYPIVTDRSKGSRIWDIDGNEYIDLVNGFGPIMLGHRPDFVTSAIAKQLQEGFETGPQTPLAGEVAKLFCEMTGNERMTYCNTGSEAVLAAMRVARTVTGRSKVVMFAGDYHGMFDEVLVKGIKSKTGEPQAAPIAPGIPRQSVANMIVLDYGAEESLEWIRRNADDLAAVMVEPVQSRHPDLQPIEFLKQLRSITAESGTALVFDEVVTGFRVHPGGCQALFGIRADLATYGKVVAGGLPVGILAGNARFMDALDGGAWQFGDDSYPEVGVTFFAGTFVRHPLVVTAMKAVLQHLREQGPALQERLNERAARLVRALKDVAVQQGIPAHIESFGSVFYLGFPAEERFASLFWLYMRDKGIHIREGFPCFLTTAHSDADLERIIGAFRESASEMHEGGFFSQAPGLAPSSNMAAAPSIAEDLLEPAADVPLTEAQREIFLAAQLGDDASCSFNESFRVELRGPLQVEALRASVNELLARHESLRATVDPERMTLRFKPDLKLEIPLRDLSILEPSARDAELARILASDARAPFDLANGPLVRVEIVRRDNDTHLLLFTSHHIVCDGWSTNVLLNDIAQIYSARAQGRPTELAPAARFSKYARAQSEQLSSPENVEIENYWVGQFKDRPASLDLPVDRPRSAVRSFAGSTYRTHIDARAYGIIKQLGAKKGCTLFATLLAGVHVLLHRLSNQSDVVIGIPAAGQSLLDDGDKLVGHCVNFLPLRTRSREDSTFTSVLGDARNLLLDAYDRQTYTYGTLVRKLALAMDPGRLPLMEVQFNLERLGASTDFHGLTAQVDPNPKGAVNFDLFFNVIESDQGLKIDCDYNTDLFDESTIARWLGHYETLLLDAASNPERSIDDLALMSPEATKSLISQWNPNARTSAVQDTVHQLFEQQAARTPDAVAIQIGEDRLSYRDLNRRANKLARLLRSRGVGPGTLVATSFERSLEMVVSMIAVLKAGGGYVPIDSSYPRERLAVLLEDAAPKILLTQAKVRSNLPDTAAEIVCVDGQRDEIDSQSDTNLEATSGPKDVAYVIYTSGSTGKPKGVLVTNGNVVRLLTSTEEWFHFGPDDVWTLFHSSSFDFSVWEIWGCLLTGGRLVVVPYLVTRSPQDFYNLLAKERVTVLNQTPAAFYQLVEVEEAGFTKPLSLRHVIFGGEALNFTKLRPWLKRHGEHSPRLVNMYGITETTVHVTYRPLTEADALGETRSLIGTAIPDLRLYLLDSKQRPVPPGVAGEIYVGGAGVTNGYLNRSDLTEERFVRDPFAGTAAARMYRSGDLARFLNGGDFEYLGRGDSQVKIHGFRIELGEIEAALAQHPGVRQCAVVTRQDRPGEHKLIGYFVPVAGKHPVTAELREFVQSKLPAHMIPYAFVELEAIPLTVNGKVDRKLLPTPDLVATASAREYVAPRNPREQTLADILAEVLRLERVGVTDDLFELGADSLHVFQITSRAAKAGLPITPKMVLQQRTIASVLAQVVGIDETKSQVSTIGRVAREKYRVKHDAREKA